MCAMHGGTAVSDNIHLPATAAPSANVAQPFSSTTLLDVIASDDDLSTLLQAVNASSVIDLVVSPMSKPGWSHTV